MSPAERRSNRPGVRSTRGRPVRAAGPPPSRRWILLLGMSLITALVLVLFFTPVLGVRSVRVQGLRTTPEQEVLAAAAVELGKPMLRVDDAAIRDRLHALPALESSQVRLNWPSTVELVVAEREPVAHLPGPGGQQLVDAAGVLFRTVPEPPPGLAQLRVGQDRDASARAAAGALAALPPELRSQVTAVSAQQPEDLHLELTGARRVHWGDEEQAQRKAAILAPLLSRPGRVYDVTSPTLPTVA